MVYILLQLNYSESLLAGKFIPRNAPDIYTKAKAQGKEAKMSTWLLQ